MMYGYSGPDNPRILLVGEAWGADEEKAKLPFVGVSGQELWRMLGQAFADIRPDLHSYAADLCGPQWGLAWVPRRNAWLEAARIGMTNVLNERPPGNKLEAFCGTKTEVGKDYPYNAMVRAKYLKPQYLHHLERLKEHIALLNPNLVVAMGNAACWALLGTGGITSLRGTTVRSSLGVKVLPTFHPASLLYEGQWSNRPIVIADLMKASREATYPEIRRPERQIIISPNSVEEVEEWIDYTLDMRPWRLAVDIETSGGMIDTIGFARSPSQALVIPFGPHRYRRGQNFVVIRPSRNGQEATNYWEFEEEVRVWHLIKHLLEGGLDLVFQNGVYDLQYLIRMGIRPNVCRDDTMLAWHSLFPEMRKSLGFIASILTDESAWKELNKHKADTARREK
jgi:uracil-DNA glycosylase